MSFLQKSAIFISNCRVSHKTVNCDRLQKEKKRETGIILKCRYCFLSYPPVDDRAGPWNTAMNAACVLHITWQLYHISHVTSIVFHCFQGRPHHLAQLTSLWRHDFSPDTQSATDRRSIFRNLFRPLFNETVFYDAFDVVLWFVLLEQTKLLDAEFKYLIIFSIWVKSTLLNWNKNNSSPN